MLLTITTTHRPALDLGYLLHKHPDRLQSFDLSFGRVHVFYPEADAERCTACLLLDVDPVGMVRGKSRDQRFLLGHYVNDRPYAASSFLSVAIAQVFGSALQGRCKDRPEVASASIPLAARIDVLPVRGGEPFLRRVFEPLGYTIEATRCPLDERFPEWGESPYYSVAIQKTTRLMELLTHLYVLVPVFDNAKHYFVGEDEMEKLLSKGEGWLAAHPEKEEITRRYLKFQPSLFREALARLVQEEEPLDGEEDGRPADKTEAVLETPLSLNEQRLGTVLAALRASGARRVLDLGCGEGKLVRALQKEKQFEEIVGMDVSIRSLEAAQRRLKLDRLPAQQAERIRLIHGSLMYRDKRLEGFDAAAVVEVVEHLDPPRLSAFERVLFEFAKPRTVVLTTPNREYNIQWETLAAGRLRHPDHRFEWTRQEFQEWAKGIAGRFGYTVRFLVVGPEDEKVGSPTQMGDLRPELNRSYSFLALSIMHITIPKLSLVVLIGPSGSGKSTFARKHFLPTEILSSDACRALVSDQENNQAVTNDAFDVVHYIAAKRLALGRLTVIDATNVQPEARKPLVALARQYHCLPVAIVLDLPERLCQERNRLRENRNFGPHVVRQQQSQLRRSLKGLGREGFRHVYVLETPEVVEAATVERENLWNDKREEHGPFDILGDVHGCYEELEALLQRLGYKETALAGDDPAWGNRAYVHPEGRKAVFLGDLVDRGPRSVDTVRLVRNMVQGGSALCVPGNHDMKLLRKLRGKNVQIPHGLANTLAEIDAVPDPDREAFRKHLAEFLDGLVSHYILDDGKLVVAHAGMKQEMQGRGSARVRDFALYGETTGETDDFGLPVRFNWAAEYRGSAMVVYGHTPVPEPEWLNRTVNIDTGCVFGGKLTALRYPEKEFVSVRAAGTYCEPARPFLAADQQAPKLTAQQLHDEVLDAEDVLGKRIIATRLRGNVTIREANATAALEVMSRFAVNPKWLIYLPPTMSPCETSSEAGLLEHPAEAFAYYRSQGAPQVICEEKHMGSRAVVIVCQDAQAARDRFGVTEGETGVIYTRTGRRFFNDPLLEREFLERVRMALNAADLWAALETTWACLDCELMPWSAKAQELLRSQYAAVGAAGLVSLPKAVAALEQAAGRLKGNDREQLDQISGKFRRQEQNVGKFVAAYRQYCWPVASLTDLKLAPFHLLATEGHVHTDKNHVWHMETLAKFCQADLQLLLPTPYRVVNVTDPSNQAEGIEWWRNLTERGGEGMVMKPLDFLHRGSRGFAQPAVKCRGREYLRIIYGPEYTEDENLVRLRGRGLGRKRALALGELALGVEGLERFVRREPLRRVHECVFGVLALESEPVDPRL